MKKLLLIAAVAVFTLTSVNAQEETTTGGFAQGDLFVSGTASYSSEKFMDNKAEVFAFVPKVGYFVADNIAVGLQLGYGFAKAESGSVDTGDVNAFRAGAFARYYSKPASQFSLFGELSFDYVTSEDKLADYKENGFDVTIAPGLSYFVSDRFALEATVGLLSYSSSKPDVDGAEATNSFSTGLDFSNINFGLVYKF